MPQVINGVASLANYNFQLYYRADKINIDVDALSRVSLAWVHVPEASGTHTLSHYSGHASPAGGHL